VAQQDVDLLEKIWSGDTNALEDTMCKMVRYVVREFHDCPCIVSDPEEVAQKALLRALHKRKTFRAESAAITWLNGFCKNVALEDMREHSKTVSLDLEHDYIPDPRPTREEEIIQDECAELKEMYANEAFESLSPREQAILRMVDGERIPVKEVAQQLGTTEDAISSLLRRIRIKLRAMLKGVADQ